MAEGAIPRLVNGGKVGIVGNANPYADGQVDVRFSVCFVATSQLSTLSEVSSEVAIFKETLMFGMKSSLCSSVCFVRALTNPLCQNAFGVIQLLKGGGLCGDYLLRCGCEFGTVAR